MITIEDRNRRYRNETTSLSRLIFDEDIKNHLQDYERKKNSEYFKLPNNPKKYNIKEFVEEVVNIVYHKVKDEENIDKELLQKLKKIVDKKDSSFNKIAPLKRILQYNNSSKFYDNQDNEYQVDNNGVKIKTKNYNLKNYEFKKSNDKEKKVVNKKVSNHNFIRRVNLKDIQDRPIEVHPSKNMNRNIEYGFLPMNIKILIVGTFPPKKIYQCNGLNIDYFFYQSSRNLFWNNIDLVYSTTKNYKELKKTNNRNENESIERNNTRKKQFCKEVGIGFIDIFTKIRRTVDSSSSDFDLRVVEDIFDSNLFFKILDNYPDLKRICTVYNTAFDYMIHKLNMINTIELYKVEKDYKNMTSNGLVYELKYENKVIEIIALDKVANNRMLQQERIRRFSFFIKN